MTESKMDDRDLLVRSINDFFIWILLQKNRIEDGEEPDIAHIDIRLGALAGLLKPSLLDERIARELGKIALELECLMQEIDERKATLSREMEEGRQRVHGIVSYLKNSNSGR